MKHYPHHIGDFDRATRHLTRTERSIYRDLIDLYYDTEQRLPLDAKVLCRKIIAHSDEESTAVEQTLNEFFTKTDTGWYHTRCEVEIEAYRSNNSQKAVAGKASAAAKALKRQRETNGDSTAVERTLPAVATDSNGAPTNQSTINQSTNQPIKTLVVATAPSVPEWLNFQAWENFKKHRGKKFTALAQALALKKLDEFRSRGHDPTAVLETSILNGWQGIFEPKNGVGNGQSGNGNTGGYISRAESRRRTLEGLTGRKRGETIDGDRATIFENVVAIRQ